MLFRLMTALATMTTTETTRPWWLGLPTKLLRKTTLVPASPGHLPVHTLTFAIPQDASSLSGRAKPHHDVAIDLGDVVKMVIPGYKPKSYSMSAMRKNDNEFDITFKVYPNGRASGYLDRLQVGDEMGTLGMSAGRRRQAGGDFVGIVAYGVGITEGLPVAKAELEKKDAKKVVLLWASRTMADTFWHGEIESLEKQYPDRFEMRHILSREKQAGCLRGRIDSKVLNEVFQPHDRSQARFLSVGTKEMMRMTDQMFSEIDYPMPKHALIPKSFS